MHLDSVLTPPPAPARPKKQARVLFALDPHEWSLFFPAGIGSAGFEAIHLPPACSETVYRDFLLEFTPVAVVTSWSSPRLPLLPDLAPDYVCHTTGSVKHVIDREFLERGGIVTNWGTLAAETVAEHAVLLILAALRRLREWDDFIGNGKEWRPSAIPTATLFRKRVAIHGFGNVAQTLVKLLRPYDVSVTAWSEGVPEEIYLKNGVTRARDLSSLIENCDVFVECEALTPKTRGILTGPLLRKLKAGAIFVNVGRGAVVDETALADLGLKGHLHLALDVFDQEPLSADSPLHRVPGAILSPHIAGPTTDQFPRCGERALRNITAYLAGKPLEGIVDLQTFDRST